MGKIILCGSEGEFAPDYERFIPGLLPIDALGADTRHRGSLNLYPSTFLSATRFSSPWVGVQDTWIHVRMAAQGWTVTEGSDLNCLEVKEDGYNNIATICSQGWQNPPAGGWWQGTFKYAPTFRAALVQVPDFFEHPNFLAEYVFHTYDIHIHIYDTDATNDTMLLEFWSREHRVFTTILTDPDGFKLPTLCSFSPKDNAAPWGQVYFQEFIVTDGIKTVGMSAATLSPTSQGFHTGFTGDYTGIDEEGFDETDFVSTDTLNNSESWVFTTPAITLDGEYIHSLVLTNLAVPDGTVTDFAAFIRKNEIDSYGADFGAVNFTKPPGIVIPEVFSTEFKTNPNTGQPWQVSDLSGVEAGITGILYDSVPEVPGPKDEAEVYNFANVVVYDLQDGATVTNFSNVIVYDLQDGATVTNLGVVVVYKYTGA